MMNYFMYKQIQKLLYGVKSNYMLFTRGMSYIKETRKGKNERTEKHIQGSLIKLAGKDMPILD